MPKEKSSSSIVERAKEHYANLERKSVLVKEWGENGQPLEIFYTPQTLAETKRITRLGKGDPFSVMAHTVAIKATDEKGNRLFTDLDAQDFLLNVDGNVVANIARAMNNLPEFKEMLKNSEAIQNSE